DPTVLAVRADSPWKTLAEFVADARKRPGAITYGSSGNYGTMHVPMEMFDAAAGIKMLHVPFTGAGPAVVALLGGTVDSVSSGPSRIRNSSPRWRLSKRRSSISTHPSSCAFGKPTTRSLAKRSAGSASWSSSATYHWRAISSPRRSAEELDGAGRQVVHCAGDL